MKKTFLTISFFLLVLGCRDPFDFEFAELQSPKVVIEGFISDRGTQHVVKVSYTARINDDNLIETQFIQDASVRVEDDLGGFTTFNHREAGVYLSAPNYQAQEGRTYTLVVTLSNGEVYHSEPKTMPPAAPARSQLSFEENIRSGLVNDELQDVEGVKISATIDKDNDRHFYQWIISNYWVYEADLAPEGALEKYCYIQDFDESVIYLLQDNPVDAGGAATYEYELGFVPNDHMLEHDYGFEGRLLTMNQEDYEFWELVQKLSANTGGLFDAAPFSLEGNMTERASGERVLGYFGVYRESIDRVFFNQSELSFDRNTYPDCVPPPGVPPDYHCYDCRTLLSQENFGVVPPVWWRN